MTASANPASSTDTANANSDNPPSLGTIASAGNNPYQLPEELFPLWNSLSFEEKIAQMIIVYMSPPNFTVNNAFGGILVMKPHLANKSLFKKNLAKINSGIKIPPLVTIDQEGGRVNRISNIDRQWKHTHSAKEMRDMPPEKIRKEAEGIGKTLHQAGFNVNLAPVLDPSSTAQGAPTFIEKENRSWGSQENLPKVKAFVEGMLSAGILSVSKHFPGYDSETNSDLQEATSNASAEDIQKYIQFFRDLYPDIPCIMMSSVRYPKISNAPAVFDRNIVKMAHDINDDIVVMTDDLWGRNLRTWISGKETVAQNPYPITEFRKVVMAALDAGNDMFMITYPARAVDIKKFILEMAFKDRKYVERIEKSTARVLKLKYRSGILKPEHDK